MIFYISAEDIIWNVSDVYHISELSMIFSIYILINFDITHLHKTTTAVQHNGVLLHDMEEHHECSQTQSGPLLLSGLVLAQSLL